MNKLNEKQIIKIFQTQLGNKNFVSDDVEFFKDGSKLLVGKTETLVESTDVPPKMKLSDIARKSVVAAVSDFAAKGVKPLFGMISVTIPQMYTEKKIRGLAKGLANAAKEFNFRFLGGDTNEGKELVIQVTLIGTSKKIVHRSGAKIGDTIIATGPFGYSKAGLCFLQKNKKGTKRFLKKISNSVFKPMPRLEFGLKNYNYFSSSMDSSDGLSTTLNEMANQSKKKFFIFQLPANSDLFEFAKKNKLNPIDLIFNGGEEYEIISTVNPKNIQRVKKSAKFLKIPLIEIGFVRKGSGVFYHDKDKTIKIKDEGWLHFRS